MAGGGAPGGLPLICRFSRIQGWQPCEQFLVLNELPPVILLLCAGTLFLVSQVCSLALALSFPDQVDKP
jgi:hypothetical protein